MEQAGRDFEKEVEKWKMWVWHALDAAVGAAKECDLDALLHQIEIAEWVRSAKRPRPESADELRVLALALDETLDMTHNVRRGIVKILKEKCGCK